MVQNTKFDARQDEIKEGRASLAVWERRLAELESQNAWVTTVTADALVLRLASANLAIEQEAAKVAARPRCLARTKSATNSPPRSRSPRKEHAHQEHRGHEARSCRGPRQGGSDERQVKAQSCTRTSSSPAPSPSSAYQSPESSKTIETATEQSALDHDGANRHELRHSACSCGLSIAHPPCQRRPAGRRHKPSLVRSASRFPPQQSQCQRKTLRALGSVTHTRAGQCRPA